MEAEKVVKFSFFLMMGAIVATLFYQIFFQIEIDGHDGGVLVFASRQAEIPMAQYYYTYSFVPNTVSTQGLDEDLGFTTKVDGSTFTRSSNISLDSNVEGDVNYSGTGDIFVDAPSPYSAIYSTGWSDPSTGW